MPMGSTFKKSPDTPLNANTWSLNSALFPQMMILSPIWSFETSNVLIIRADRRFQIFGGGTPQKTDFFLTSLKSHKNITDG